MLKVEFATVGGTQKPVSKALNLKPKKPNRHNPTPFKKVIEQKKGKKNLIWENRLKKRKTKKQKC